MSKLHASLLLVVVLSAGCATSPSEPKRAWVASSRSDEFTDKRFSMVTVGSYYWGKSVYTQTGKLYPFVGYVDGELLVGVRSGGTYRMPVGNVQLRIDDNVTWTITTAETPTDILGVNAPAYPKPEGLTPEIAAAVASTQKIMTASVSPFTAATGDKARDILKQMLAGKVLRYRAIGLGQQASSTGEVKLDPSLAESLIKAGIPLPQ